MSSLLKDSFRCSALLTYLCSHFASGQVLCVSFASVVSVIDTVTCLANLVTPFPLPSSSSTSSFHRQDGQKAEFVLRHRLMPRPVLVPYLLHHAHPELHSLSIYRKQASLLSKENGSICLHPTAAASGIGPRTTIVHRSFWACMLPL